jgi:hypothetical protein
MFDNSAIAKTGQAWKGIAAISVVILGSLIMFAGMLSHSRDQSLAWFSVTLGGMALAALGFAFGCWSIRCPECGSRWLWLAVTKRGVGSWLEWLVSRTQCPTCKRTW